MGPELFNTELRGHRRTEHSDCYALGMVIYEVLSGHVPFHEYANWAVPGKVVRGDRPGRPQGEWAQFTDGVWEVLERCWDAQPRNRPSVEDVLRCLEKVSRFWTPPSLPPVALPVTIDPFTSKTGEEESMGMDVSLLSRPSDKLPPKSDADNKAEQSDRDIDALSALETIMAIEMLRYEAERLRQGILLHPAVLRHLSCYSQLVPPFPGMHQGPLHHTRVHRQQLYAQPLSRTDPDNFLSLLEPGQVRTW